MGTRAPSYYTGNLTGTAGSLITALDAILITGEGWTSPFSGTNEKQYQQAGGNGFRLYVNDNATGAGAAREAIVRGCESSTALATLTDPFPTTALVADAACVWRKSDTADATTRPYWAVADDSLIVLCVQFATNSFDLYIFGDVEPVWSGDNYNTIINTRGIANSTGTGVAIGNGPTARIDDTAASNLWWARTASGLTKVERAAALVKTAAVGAAAVATIADYPHPETTKFHMVPLVLRGSGTNSGTSAADGAMTRGYVPFIFVPEHGTGITGMAPLDTFTDTSYDASSDFIVFQSSSSTNLALSTPRWVLQTAGTWDIGV